MRIPASVKKIYRYPVKGLSAEPMERAILTAGQTIPGDRRYAIENGPIGFDPAAPAYFPKQRFLMLMRNERLARLDTRFDETTDTLALRDGGEAVRGDLRTPEGRERPRRSRRSAPTSCAAARAGRPPGHSFPRVAQGRLHHQPASAPL
jgi:hypothetical protein